MRLIKTDKKAVKSSEMVLEKEKVVQEILKILQDVKSSFTVAKYFLALNQRPEMISSYVFEGCRKFEMAKKLLTSTNGLKKDKSFLWRFEDIEKDISCLKKILQK